MGPFGVTFGVVGVAVFCTFGVEGVICGLVAGEFWGVAGDAGVGCVEALGGLGLPHPSRVLRVIRRGCAFDAPFGVAFFSSEGVEEEEASLLTLGEELASCDDGGEFLDAAGLFPFFSLLFGTKTSKVGGSLRGVPSSPGEKDRKEQ